MTSLALTVQPSALPFVRAWVESIRSRSKAETERHVVEAVACAAASIAHLANGEHAEAVDAATRARLHYDAAKAHERVVRQCDITLRGHAYDAARSGR